MDRLDQPFRKCPKGLVINYGEGGGGTKQKVREGGGGGVKVKFYPYKKGVGVEKSLVK